MRFKYLNYLVTIIITLGLMCNFSANRLIEVRHLHLYLSSTIFMVSLFYVCCDVCAEVYGYVICRQVLWCYVLASLLSALCIFIILRLPASSATSVYALQYDATMTPYFRMMISGILGVMAGQFVNIYVISKTKIMVRGKYFWIRSISSGLIGEITNSIFIGFFFWYGRIPTDQIIKLIICSRIVGTILQAIFASPAISIIAFLKKAENIDAYDYGVNFNPFVFSVKNNNTNSAEAECKGES